MVDRQLEDTPEVEEAQTPILENMVLGVPPVFEGLTKQLDKIVEQPLLGPKAEFPAGMFKCIRKDGKRGLTVGSKFCIRPEK
jgi:tubulin gamma